ncbi:MAG: hypothetical protein ACOCX2_01975, partial [Armatimonadota bacterium]
MDDSRGNDIRPDGDAGEERSGEPPRSPYEPPREAFDERPAEDAPEAPPERPDTEPAPRPDDDVFSRLNVAPDAPAEPDLPGGDAQPPFIVTERDFGVSEEPKGPSKAATFVAFGVVVLAVIGILMTIASVKLFMERAEMSAALEQSSDQLAMMYAGPDATDTSKRRIAWLRKTLDEGDFAQARKAIQSLGAPEVERPSPLDITADSSDGPDGPDAGGNDGPQRSLPEPAEDTSLPIKAQAFFEQHPELWEAFFGFSVAIRRMQQAEVPVEGLMGLRSQMVEAAELGQTQKVEGLLRQASEQIGGQSQDRVPEGLQKRLQQFGQAIQQAQRERRDVRAAVKLAQQSERAAQQGDIQRAEQLMDRAIAAVKNAPRVRMPQQRPGPGGPDGRQMPQMGPEIGLIKFVADLATNVMQAEQRDLTEIWESINIAAGAIREKNAEQIREILGEAKESFHEIGDRRREMQAAIQRAQEKVQQSRAGEAPPPGSAGPSEEEQRERQEIVMERVETLLAQVREMPESEFEANRAQIAQAVLQAMTAPVRTPGEGPARPEMTPEERVREKMRLAGEMYRELQEKTDADTAELDEKFAEVRERITEHEYERAEELVDEGVAMMRAMASGEMPVGGEGGEGAGDYGPQLQLDAPAPSLNLRSGDGEPRLPGPSVPNDAEDMIDANEG